VVNESMSASAVMEKNKKKFSGGPSKQNSQGKRWTAVKAAA